MLGLQRTMDHHMAVAAPVNKYEGVQCRESGALACSRCYGQGLGFRTGTHFYEAASQTLPCEHTTQNSGLRIVNVRYACDVDFALFAAVAVALCDCLMTPSLPQLGEIGAARWRLFSS